MSLLMWVIAVVFLVAAALLVTGTGAAGLWIALIAVGVAMVVIELGLGVTLSSATGPPPPMRPQPCPDRGTPHTFAFAGVLFVSAFSFSHRGQRGAPLIVLAALGYLAATAALVLPNAQ